MMGEAHPYSFSEDVPIPMKQALDSLINPDTVANSQALSLLWLFTLNH